MACHLWNTQSARSHLATMHQTLVHIHASILIWIFLLRFSLWRNFLEWIPYYCRTTCSISVFHSHLYCLRNPYIWAFNFPVSNLLEFPWSSVHLLISQLKRYLQGCQHRQIGISYSTGPQCLVRQGHLRSCTFLRHIPNVFWMTWSLQVMDWVLAVFYLS